jgi:ribonuclease HI
MKIKKKIIDLFTEKKTNGSVFLTVVDGGSKGNPGPSYFSYKTWWERPNEEMLARKHDIVDFDEEHTNNQAEFLALLAVLSNALKFAIKSEGQHHVHVASDSQLLISAVTGEKYLHNEELQDLHSQIELIVDSLTHYGVSVDIQWMSDSVVKQHLGH